jgi:hypothetical protein
MPKVSTKPSPPTFNDLKNRGDAAIRVSADEVARLQHNLRELRQLKNIIDAEHEREQRGRREIASFSVCDVPFRFRTNVPEAETLISNLYRNFARPDLDGPIIEAVLESGTSGKYCWRFLDKAESGTTLSRALWNLESALCETIIRSQERSVAIHAATIQMEDSVALVAGRTDAGKTTLSLALAGRALSVAGDDVALVDPETLNVFPIPRCFHLDDNAIALLEADGLRLPPAWRRSRFISPNDFGVRAKPFGHAHCAIFMQGPRAEHPSITPISQAEMSARLLSETGQGPLDHSETIKVVCALCAGARCFALTPGPLTETADAVASLLAQSRRAAG